MPDLTKHPAARSAMADQDYSDFIWSRPAEDIQNMLHALRRDPDAARLHSELEDVIDQAVTVLLMHSDKAE